MDKKITEDQLTRPDVKSILKAAVAQKNEPTGLGRYVKQLRKPKLDIADLQKAWASINYRADTDSIYKLLSQQGFSKAEINKIFKNVFGHSDDTESGYETPPDSAATMKLARYIIKNDMQEEILQYLQDEFGIKETRFPETLVVEEIRQIFTQIVEEERSGRADLIRKHEQTHLGRSKK